MGKSILNILCLAGVALVLSAGPAGATRLNQEDGILPNHSSDYVRTLNRFASTEADAAFYNPAGLAFMEKNGLHVQFSSQTYYAKRTHSMDYYAIKFMDNPWSYTSNYSNPGFSGIPKEYTAETIAPCLPGLDIIYKGKNWAVYLDVGVLQAAPGMTFKQGLAIMDWGNLAQLETMRVSGGPPYTTNLVSYSRTNFARRTEYYIGGTVGGSYKFLDWLSAALGIRYIYATGNQSLSVKNSVATMESGGAYSAGTINPWLIDVDMKGQGAGIIMGLDFKPTDSITIGIKYEYYPPMKLKKKTNKFIAPGNIVSSGNLNIFLDSWAKLPLWDSTVDISKMNIDSLKNVGSEIKVTYPQTISFGFSVNIIKSLRAEISGEASLRPFRDLDGREKDWNVGWRAGGCLEWRMVPAVRVSAGYVYNDFGIKPSRRNEVDPMLCSHSIGGGFAFNVTDWLDVTVGALYMIYIPAQLYYTEYTNITGATMHALKKDFDERRFSVTIGLTARLFGSKSSSGSGSEETDIKLK